MSVAQISSTGEITGKNSITLNYSGSTQPTLNINANGVGGVGKAIINLNPWSGRGTDSCHIEAVNDSNYSANLGFFTANGGSTTSTPQNRMTITSNGNVGINTTNPSAQLEVNGTLLVRNTVTVNNSPYTFNIGKAMSASENGIWMNMSDSTTGVIQGENQGKQWNNVCINPYAGNVGIGKFNPGYKLDVNGSLNAGDITGASISLGGGVYANSSNYAFATGTVTGITAYSAGYSVNNGSTQRRVIDQNGAITGASLTVGSTGTITCGSIQIGNTSISDPGGTLATQSYVQSQGYVTSGSGSNPIFGTVNLRGGLTTTFTFFGVTNTYNVVGPLGTLYEGNVQISNIYARLAGGPIFTNGLTINGQYGTTTNNTGKYYISSIGSNTINSANTNTYTGTYVGLICQYLVQTATGFIVNSDQRIKKNIQNLSPEESLHLVQSLKPVSFDYIDYTKGTNKKYGYIAQDIESVLPTAINHSSEYIPNIFEKVQIDTTKTKIRLTNKTTDIFELPKDKTQKIKLKFYDASNNEILREIQEIIDNKTILLSKPITENPLFLYGQEVSDFRSIENEQINVVLLSAVQAQQKKIVSLESKNVSLETKIEALEKKIEFLMTKIT